MLSIQNNILAMFSNRQLSITAKNQEKIAEKTGSGYKINRAADDAAGLTISENMRHQIRGLAQASKNAQDGISMLQIAEGGMAEIQDMLHRCSELAVKASNGTLTDDDREAIQREIDQLVQETDSISTKTEFNEKLVLNGNKAIIKNGAIIKGSLPAWVSYTPGGSMSDTYVTNERYVSTNPLAPGGGSLPVNHASATIDFSSFTGTSTQISELVGGGFHFTCCTCDNHYSVNFTAGTANSTESSGNHHIYNTGIDGLTTASDLVDKIIQAVTNNPDHHYTKLAKDPLNPNKLIIYDDRKKDNNAVLPPDTVWDNSLWQNANSGNALPSISNGLGLFAPGVAFSPSFRESGGDLALQIGATSQTQDRIKILLPDMSVDNLGIGRLNLRTQSAAQLAMETIYNANSFVSEERSRMGAYQNRLEHTIASLDNTVENTQAAESLVRDADMAKCMVEYAKDNILNQVGQAMLASANQKPYDMLSLLQ